MDSKTLQTLRRDAEDICRSAIEASVPDAAIQRALAQLPPCQGRTVLVSIGKAGWQTAKAAYDALGSAIDRASLIAREGKSNLVCFKLDGETLEVSSNSETGDMEEKMQVITEGKDLTIAFNVRYITDVLKALSDDQIVMRFNSNVSPCVVCPVEGDSYLYLVLPVRVFNA